MRQFIFLLVIGGLVLGPDIVHAAGAAAMSLDQDTYTVEVGERFDVIVSINPNGEELDTARAILTFDPTVLFIHGANLVGSFNREAPGNYYDNGTGIVSWGGFTIDGLITTQTPFTTVTFEALQTGEAQIEISADSKAISNGEETIDVSALDEASVTAVEAAPSQEGTALLVVESETHPNEVDWYQERNVGFTWTALEGDSAITAYYYALDESSDTDPTVYLSSSEQSVTLKEVPDGVHYFHLKAVQGNGKVTKAIHRKVQIDATAPNPIELTAQDEKLVEGESLWLTFATTDETSGVLQYQIAINDSAFQVQQSPLEFVDVKAGTYFFRVAALDRAGNTIYSGKSIRVYPAGTDLGHPEGYEQNQEASAIAQGTAQALENQESDSTLLITLALGAIVAFGIIYATIKRRK